MPEGIFVFINYKARIFFTCLEVTIVKKVFMCLTHILMYHLTSYPLPVQSSTGILYPFLQSRFTRLRRIVVLQPSKDTLIFTARCGRFFGTLLRGKRYDHPRELLYSRSSRDASSNPTGIRREKGVKENAEHARETVYTKAFLNLHADKYGSTKVYAKLKNNAFYQTYTFH